MREEGERKKGEREIRDGRKRKREGETLGEGEEA